MNYPLSKDIFSTSCYLSPWKRLNNNDNGDGDDNGGGGGGGGDLIL